MDLYLIALLPPEELREQIKGYKEGMRDRFNAERALRSPAHITLQQPFKRQPEIETKLIKALQAIADGQKPFLVELSGFDCFKPKVIFIKIMDHEPIKNLHQQIKKILKNLLDFKADELTYKVHPHITIAYRDLSPQAFENAWPEYEKKDFKASFKAKSIFLLKHNGKFWDIYKEFLFDKKN